MKELPICLILLEDLTARGHKSVREDHIGPEAQNPGNKSANGTEAFNMCELSRGETHVKCRIGLYSHGMLMISFSVAQYRTYLAGFPAYSTFVWKWY